MAKDPLTEALKAIEPKLDSDMSPLVAALLDGEPIEDAWQQLLAEVLDET